MGNILLHGDCLINRASELHQLLVHHLNDPDPHLEIDMSSTGRCDLSFLQLVCAAAQSFAQKGKPVTLVSDLPRTVLDQLRKCGWFQACAACPQSDCFLKKSIRDMAADNQ